MKEKHKFSNLTKLLDIDNPKSAIIFGRTKRRVDEITRKMRRDG
jgi:ATP-dependent RNA helicase DeaD